MDGPTWREVREESLSKWRALRDRVGTASVRSFVEEVTEACAFCLLAAEQQEFAKAAGVSHSSVQCLFCDAYQRYGGCKERIDQLLDAALREELTEVEVLVAEMIAWLEGMEPPVVAHALVAG